MDGRKRHDDAIHHHPDKLAIQQSRDHWPCVRIKSAGWPRSKPRPNKRDQKVQEVSQRRGLRAALKRFRPQQPEATD